MNFKYFIVITSSPFLFLVGKFILLEYKYSTSYVIFFSNCIFINAVLDFLCLILFLGIYDACKEVDRQLALMNFSIEAGILLRGNGVSHAMACKEVCYCQKN